MKIPIIALIFSFFPLTLFASGIPILPDKLPSDTFNVMNLPWVHSAESYRSVASDIETDEEGNVYVCGYFEQWINLGKGEIAAEGDEQNSSDIFLAKYDALGNLLWLETAGSKEDDKALSMDISGDNIYITGYFSHICYFGEQRLLTKDRQNMFLASYSRQGKIKWVVQAKSDGILRGQAVAADANGNVYVTGNFRKSVAFGSYRVSARMDKNAYLAKFDSLGEVQWLKQFGGGNSLITYLYVYDIECDANNDILVAGEMMGRVRFDQISYTTRSEYLREGALPRREVFMARYSADGKVKWMKSMALEANFGDMNIAANNDILITGYFTGSLDGKKKGQALFGRKALHTHPDPFGDNTEDIYVARYSPEGSLRWALAFGGEAQDRGQGISSDRNGNVYVTGFFTGQMAFGESLIESKRYRADKKDIFTARINADGSPAWIRRAGSSKEDMGNAIASDPFGNIYISGTFEGNANFGQNWVSSKMYQNAFIAKYHSSLPE